MASRKSHHDARSLATTRPVKSRRKLLKSALLGGGAAAALYSAPERWTRPVIEAVSLPAHAQTSPGLGEGLWSGGSAQIAELNTPGRGRTLASRVADILLPRAHALNEQPPLCIASFGICIARTGTGSDIEVRSGFNGILEDERATPVDNNLKFAFNFDDYNVTGKYDPANDRWTGRVIGPCPSLENTSSSDRSIFTGERIQVASASQHLQLAGIDEPDGLDLPWEARPNDICEFVDD